MVRSSAETGSRHLTRVCPGPLVGPTTATPTGSGSPPVNRPGPCLESVRRSPRIKVIFFPYVIIKDWSSVTYEFRPVPFKNRFMICQRCLIK